MMSELDSHMLKELWHSVCNPENPDRLEAALPVLRERVTRIETKLSVVGTIMLAAVGIGGAVTGAWHRIVK